MASCSAGLPGLLHWKTIRRKVGSALRFYRSPPISGSSLSRDFCGSPCPAEAHEMNGGMHRTGAFCEFYEEQVRYAFRLIADDKVDAFLWDGWNKGLKDTFVL